MTNRIRTRPSLPRSALALTCLAALAGPAAAVDYCLLIEPNSCNSPAEVSKDYVVVDGETYELSHGLYRSRTLLVGDEGTGAVTQTGGVNTVTERLTIAGGIDSQGSYLLANGIFNATVEAVGVSGRASFVQLGGLHVLSGPLQLGLRGTYQMSGGTFNLESIVNGGSLQQTGGTMTVSGDMDNSFADISINGGSFSVGGNVRLSHTVFIQRGGDVHVRRPLVAGEASSGFYIYGGTLHGDVHVSGGGLFSGQGGAVSGTVRVSDQSAALIGGTATTRVGSYLAQGSREMSVSGSLLAIDTMSFGAEAKTVMFGGNLSSDGVFVNDGLISGHGTLGGNGRISGSGRWVADGGVLTLAPRGGSRIDGVVSVAGANTLELQTPLTMRGSLQLAGGSVRGGGALVLEAGGRLTGWGTVDNAITTNDGRIEAAGGTLQLSAPLRNTGTLVVQAGAALTGGAIDNRGSMDVQGRLGSALRNSGSVQVGKAVFDGDVVLTGAGSFTVGGIVAEFANLTLERGAVLDLANEAIVLVHGAASFAPDSLIRGIGNVAFDGAVEISAGGFGVATIDHIVRALPGSRLLMDLGGTAATQHDRLAAALTSLENGTLVLRLAGGFTPHAGDSFDLFDGNLNVYGVQLDTRQAPLAEGLYWDSALLSQTGELRVLAVPEPPAGQLALAGAALLLVLQRRRSAH